MIETSTVTVEVLEVSRVPALRGSLTRRGRLQGFAQVELVLDGVPIILQGVRIMRRADGLSTVEMPVQPHLDGDWVPAVVLPWELEQAIARAVLEGAGGQIRPCCDGLSDLRPRHTPPPPAP